MKKRKTVNQSNSLGICKNCGSPFVQKSPKLCIPCQDLSLKLRQVESWDCNIQTIPKFFNGYSTSLDRVKLKTSALRVLKAAIAFRKTLNISNKSRGIGGTDLKDLVSDIMNRMFRANRKKINKLYSHSENFFHNNFNLKQKTTLYRFLRLYIYAIPMRPLDGNVMSIFYNNTFRYPFI